MMETRERIECTLVLAALPPIADGELGMQRR
jgi:hypothetical protein